MIFFKSARQDFFKNILMGSLKNTQKISLEISPMSPSKSLFSELLGTSPRNPSGKFVIITSGLSLVISPKIFWIFLQKIFQEIHPQKILKRFLNEFFQ